MATDLPDPTRRRRLNRFGELEPYSNLISVGLRFQDYDDSFHVFSDEDDDEEIDAEYVAELFSIFRHQILNQSNQSDFYYDEDDFESDEESWHP